jgi:hypothetical protein
MLAWKEKVADRLARLLADSPPTSSTAVQPQVSDLGYPYPQAARLPHIASDLFFCCYCFSSLGRFGSRGRIELLALRRFLEHGKAGPWRFPDLGLLPWTKAASLEARKWNPLRNAGFCRHIVISMCGLVNRVNITFEKHWPCPSPRE